MLESLAARKSDIRVRKVDINRPGVKGIDFQSPVARQYIKQGVPQFEVYDGSGKLIAEEGDAYQKILEYCRQAGMTEDELRKAGIIR